MSNEEMKIDPAQDAKRRLERLVMPPDGDSRKELICLWCRKVVKPGKELDHIHAEWM